MTDVADATARRLSAMNDVLRVAVRHANVLAPAALEELAQTLARHVPFGRLAVLVRDGDAKRVYAVSSGPSDLVPFGGRVPALPASD
ncbi:MAG TPA: hypothetical protein VHB21_23425, partial [Minicystis sp.]|nr:hypothetical protein [Minicystis sp.]